MSTARSLNISGGTVAERSFDLTGTDSSAAAERTGSVMSLAFAIHSIFSLPIRS